MRPENEEVVRQELGRRIVEIRERQGMSQAELARRLGVERCRLSHWERGSHMPSLMQVIQLGATLEAGFDELVPGQKPPAQPGAPGLPLEQYDRLARHLQTALEIVKVERKRSTRKAQPGALRKGIEIPSPIPARG